MGLGTKNSLVIHQSNGKKCLYYFCFSKHFPAGKVTKDDMRLSLENCHLCNHHLLFIAFISLSSPCTGQGWTCCPQGWRRFQRSCYFLSIDKMSWAESEQNCTGMGSQLVVINSKAEQVRAQG